MEALNIQIVNPKAKSLLFDLAEMDLIRIETKPLLSGLLAKLRRNESTVPSPEEIAKEVDFIRQNRYGTKV
jgi:secreted protein with Ig-like and vWFA domain